MKGAREAKAAKQRDKEDRESYERRIVSLVVRERPDVSPEDVEITWVGDLTEPIIFIPEKKKGKKSKLAHKLKDGI